MCAFVITAIFPMCLSSHQDVRKVFMRRRDDETSRRHSNVYFDPWPKIFHQPCSLNIQFVFSASFSLLPENLTEESGKLVLLLPGQLTGSHTQVGPAGPRAEEEVPNTALPQPPPKDSMPSSLLWITKLQKEFSEPLPPSNQIFCEQMAHTQVNVGP